MVYAINDQGRLAGLWRKLLMISEGFSSLVFAIIAQRRYTGLLRMPRITGLQRMTLMMREGLPVSGVCP